MSRLFDPVRIKELELRNRLFRSATVENFGIEGMVTDSLLGLYRELARGEAGLIFTGGFFPEKAGQCFPGQLGVHTEKTIPGLKRLVQVVHENGGRVAAQILHGGWFGRPEVTGFQPKGPTGMINPHTGLQVHELSGDEVHEIVDAFVRAAQRLIEAGFDAIQLHGAHSYVISSFLSPVTNRRRDEWGGSPENRFRFVREILQGIRKVAGADYPVLIKLGVVDSHPEGKPLSEGIETAKALEADGIDAIEISEGLEEKRAHHIRLDATTPYYLHEARQARRVLALPLILVGGMRTLKDMEAVLDEGIADAISMCRPFIMDPHIVRKFREGLTDASECTSCNGCHEEMKQGNMRCVLV
jgi:2,4-dienoyl-CoA reductase-like NADH-dependent reductase (Old Yellow Enzyme family)